MAAACGTRRTRWCAVTNLDLVLPGDRRVSHLVGDRMASIAGQPVDTASDQEVST
jgi:hypothetical protein